MPLLSSRNFSKERASVFSFSSLLLAALRRTQHCMNTTAARTRLYARLAIHPRTLAWSSTVARSATNWGERIESKCFISSGYVPEACSFQKIEIRDTADGQEEVCSDCADLSVCAACQCAPGEGLDGDGGLADHEEQLSDHHHAVHLLDH